ncbi:unnamed protein product [Adineta ricciae]|uniref:Protein kinase domain-containing protein n=1 Tax=Adineta ricciae TaxID=249248 RepID=A0A815XBU0_ADIRI|nr:unnamed protein product [Adineta ricciae]
MGQEESVPIKKENVAPVLHSNCRKTIENLALQGRALPINRGQYKFGHELGSGAFGTVYSARRVQDNKAVAIKVVSLVTLNNKEGLMLTNSILTEIEMSKSLSQVSNHVVRMYDFDFHRKTGLAFLIMELGERDLEKLLKERLRLTSTERKEVWRQCVDIAMTLHDNKIVHLDIKPQNLVIFPGNKIKLVDLGIAQRAYKHRVGSNGTWLYSAPEVTNAARGQMMLNTSKADVWSWGAVLYRMTYSEPPKYTRPCFQPPKHLALSKDSNLTDVLRHTLVSDPVERADPPWLAQHPYTTS